MATGPKMGKRRPRSKKSKQNNALLIPSLGAVIAFIFIIFLIAAGVLSTSVGGVVCMITLAVLFYSMFKPKITKNWLKIEESQSSPIEKEIDNTTVILLYILSFFIPLAGFIVGAIYASKDEEHYKHVGKNCLIFSVLNLVLGFIMIAAILGSM
jgi:Mn2+/Fe2+ NRAMP family transporter